MDYKRLPFGQYYIDTSKDWRKTGKARFSITYNHVEFTYKLFKIIPLKCSAEWEVHYEPERDVIQVNFEQTHGWKDWVINILFKEKMYDKFTWYDSEAAKFERIQLKASKGWKKMYFAMKHEMKVMVKKYLEEHPTAEIEVIGWSLGSSQAQLAVQDLNYHFHGKKIHCYTSGSVKPWRCGKKERKYLNTCCTECWNFMHRRDIVTYMPPFIGFFAINPVKLGKFNFFSLFNPNHWHTEYGEDYLYEGIE